MSEQYKRCCNNTTETDVEANAAAFAFNKNFNLLYAPEFPQYPESDPSTMRGNKEDIGSLFQNLFKNKDEYKAEAEATGQAKIENTNLNLFITI